MAFFEWDEKYETGIVVIDLQHRNIFSMITEISEQIIKENNESLDETIENTINQLIDYTNYHFQTEETLFKECNYLDSEQHISGHDDLRGKVDAFYTRLAKDEDISLEFLNFLKTWLKNHILVSDMKYVEHIKKHKPEL